MCLPVSVMVGFYGVVCTDVKLSELLKDVEFFESNIPVDMNSIFMKLYVT
jgi:hypothetical protein